MLADGHGVREFETTFLQGFEDHVRRHELGEARRLHAIVGVALGDDSPAEVVDEDIGARAHFGRLRDRSRVGRPRGN